MTEGVGKSIVLRQTCCQMPFADWQIISPANCCTKYLPIPSNPTLEAIHRGWNHGTVPKIALAVYDERAFNRLPILPDALTSADCANEDIPAYCRSGGEHMRGCWVVDLVLGKE